METTPIVKWLRKQIRNRKTPIVVFCGETRSGKTMFSMRVAWELYPRKFSFSKNVAGSIEKWFELYDKTDHNVIILDEASVSLYLYDWSNILQKVFTHVTNTQAYKHNIVFLVLPQVSELGKVFRYKPNAIVEVNRYGQRVYYKYFIVHKNYSNLNFGQIKQSFIGEFGAVPLPPDDIVKDYLENGQQSFKEEIMARQRKTVLAQLNPTLKKKPVL